MLSFQPKILVSVELLLQSHILFDTVSQNGHCVSKNRVGLFCESLISDRLTFHSVSCIQNTKPNFMKTWLLTDRVNWVVGQDCTLLLKIDCWWCVSSPVRARSQVAWFPMRTYSVISVNQIWTVYWTDWRQTTLMICKQSLNTAAVRNEICLA